MVLIEHLVRASRAISTSDLLDARSYAPPTTEGTIQELWYAYDELKGLVEDVWILSSVLIGVPARAGGSGSGTSRVVVGGSQEHPDLEDPTWTLESSLANTSGTRLTLNGSSDMIGRRRVSDLGSPSVTSTSDQDIPDGEVPPSRRGSWISMSKGGSYQGSRISSSSSSAATAAASSLGPRSSFSFVQPFSFVSGPSVPSPLSVGDDRPDHTGIESSGDHPSSSSSFSSPYNLAPPDDHDRHQPEPGTTPRPKANTDPNSNPNTYLYPSKRHPRTRRRRLSLPYIRRRLVPLLRVLLAIGVLATAVGIVEEVAWRWRWRVASGARAGAGVRARSGSGSARQGIRSRGGGMGTGAHVIGSGDDGIRWEVPHWLDTGWIESVSSSSSSPSHALPVGPDPSGLGVVRRKRGNENESEGVTDGSSGAGSEGKPSDPQVVPSAGEPHRPIRRRRRVLFLTDYHDYLERMNTNTYEIVDAALRLDPSSASYGRHHSRPPSGSDDEDDDPTRSAFAFDRRPDVELDVDVWGPGWAGWSPTIPVSENVRRRSWAGEPRRARARASRAIEVERDREIRVERQQEGRWTEGWADWWRARRAGRGVITGSSALDPEGSGTVMSTDRVDDVFDVMNIPGGCPPEGFDFVWTFSDIFKQGDPLLDAMPCGSVLVQQLGDCHSLNCLSEWYPNASNITLSKYGFELLDVFHPKILEDRFPGMEMQLFGYSADSANEWDFWPVEEAVWREAGEGGDGPMMVQEKKVDAMMFGYTMPFYPIRTTVHESVESPRPHLIQRYEHPGYYVWETGDAYTNPLSTYVEDHVSYAQHRIMRRDFARAMRETRVCVFDASVERKMIRKYAQAMLSGCVIAADLPTEHENDLSEFMIQLDPSWEIERIEEVVQGYLDRPDLLRKMSQKGVDFARRKLTNTRKIVDVVRIVDAYKAGKRGYDCESSKSFALLALAHRGDLPPTTTDDA